MNVETPIVISMGGHLTREQFPIANFRVRQVRPDEGASLESSSLYKAMVANLVDHSFFMSTKIVYLTLRMFLKWAILSRSFIRVAQHNYFRSALLWHLVGIVCLLCAFFVAVRLLCWSFGFVEVSTYLVGGRGYERLAVKVSGKVEPLHGGVVQRVLGVEARSRR